MKFDTGMTKEEVEFSEIVNTFTTSLDIVGRMFGNVDAVIAANNLRAAYKDFGRARTALYESIEETNIVAERIQKELERLTEL